jgi:hypothetical protein
VLWRFRFLVLGGFVLGILLAALSLAKVTFAHGRPALAYREPTVWAAQETLLITQRGFPEGRVSVDPGNLSGLSVFYSRLANSDAVQSQIPLIEKDKPLPSVTAAPAISYVAGNASLLPMLTITGEATTWSGTIQLTRVASNTFRTYIEQRQAAAAIPRSQRVIISVLNAPSGATVVQSHKKTIPLMVFVAVLAATVGLALILENVRPLPRSPAVEPAPLQHLAGHRPQHPPLAGADRADAGR